jgi:DNA-binding transcriptional LysR family regulator
VIKPKFTIEQVRTFAAVAAREHISRAAESLELSQGAATQQVHLFEKSLGVTLLERVGRNVRLTDAGREVAVACQVAMRALEGIDEAARAARTGEIGSLHVGASLTTANHHVHEPLTRLLVRYPGLHVQVTVEVTVRICEQIQAGLIDCGVVEDPVPDLGLQTIALCEDQVVLVVKPDSPLAARRDLTPMAFEGQRYLARHPMAAMEAVAREMLGASYGAVRRLELGTLEAVRAGAIAGLGFAAMPLVSVEPDIREGRLARLAFPSYKRWIRGVRRKSTSSPAVEEFWKELMSSASVTPTRAAV